MRGRALLPLLLLAAALGTGAACRTAASASARAWRFSPTRLLPQLCAAMASPGAGSGLPCMHTSHLHAVRAVSDGTGPDFARLHVAVARTPALLSAGAGSPARPAARSLAAATPHARPASSLLPAASHLPRKHPAGCTVTGKRSGPARLAQTAALLTARTTVPLQARRARAGSPHSRAAPATRCCLRTMPSCSSTSRCFRAPPRLQRAAGDPLDEEADRPPRLQNFASDAFTFEAWIQTSDYCNRGAIMSYSKNSVVTDDPTPYNHFVVFDELNLLACHDFQVPSALEKGIATASQQQQQLTQATPPRPRSTSTCGRT